MYQYSSLNCNKRVLLGKMLIAGELRDVQGVLEHLVLCLRFLCIFQIVVKNQVYLKIIIRTISEYHFVTIWSLVSVSEVIKI